MNSQNGLPTTLSTLSEVSAFVEQVELDNHETLGFWTAAQNFYHLAAAFEASMEGLPKGYPAVIRWIIRPFRWFVILYRFPPLLPIPQSIRFKLQPPRDADFGSQKARLLNSIRQFQDFTGAPPPHPVLGSLSRDEWLGFHLRHSQHHLSFIKLKSQ